MSASIGIPQRDIQRLFNDGKYAEKVQAGIFKTKIVKDKHPAPSFLPYCTHSQCLSYHDESGKKIAIVHQYLKPDGTLGASGLPDPKLLIHNGKRYHAIVTPRK
jgi:hypothetical protein